MLGYQCSSILNLDTIAYFSMSLLKRNTPAWLTEIGHFFLLSNSLPQITYFKRPTHHHPPPRPRSKAFEKHCRKGKLVFKMYTKEKDVQVKFGFNEFSVL